MKPKKNKVKKKDVVQQLLATGYTRFPRTMIEEHFIPMNFYEKLKKSNKNFISLLTFIYDGNGADRRCCAHFCVLPGCCLSTGVSLFFASARTEASVLGRNFHFELFFFFLNSLCQNTANLFFHGCKVILFFTRLLVIACVCVCSRKKKWLYNNGNYTTSRH